jgi:hypothetical protein
LNHLNKREKVEYVKRAADEVREDHFSKSLKLKINKIRNKGNIFENA